MRIVLSIVLVMFVSYLTPQITTEKKDFKSSVVRENKTINYDSILKEIQLDTELIKKDKEIIKENENLVKKEELKRKKLISELKEEIKRIKTQKETIYIKDTVCVSCKIPDSIN